MSMMDAAQTKQVYVVDRAESANKSPENRFYYSLLAEVPNIAVKNKLEQTLVKDIGQLSSMDLNGKWEEVNYSNLRAGASFKEFRAPGDPDVSFNFYYRGSATDQTSAVAFRNTLAAPDHHLSTGEIKALDLVLRNKSAADGFSMLNCQTQTIDNKRVLVVEGRYNEKKVDVKSIYVDAGANPGIVQEIYFQSPADRYSKYKADLNKAFQSIEWKSMLP
ncbi:MAG: hypothetical protein JST44_24560 [Cyanobacteria bacterium SZAS LIN-5]|nr:hypothetical protein [Cyanobacteria bacterium SZAS LIN-5]